MLLIVKGATVIASKISIEQMVYVLIGCKIYSRHTMQFLVTEMFIQGYNYFPRNLNLSCLMSRDGISTSKTTSRS